MLSYCGLDCAQCPAFLAYRDDDQGLRERTAPEWSRLYGAALKPEDINCVGCTLTEGVHIGHSEECSFRGCGLAHKISNCGECPDYPCPGLADFHRSVPQARENLDRYRQAQ